MRFLTSLKFLKLFLIIIGLFFLIVINVPAQEKIKEIKIVALDKVFLKSRQFVPGEGISETLKEKIKLRAPEKSYVLLQLEHIPTKEEKKQLEKEGIKLLSYIPNKAWFSSVPSDIPEKIKKFPNIKAVNEILIEDKISPSIREFGVDEHARNPDGTVDLTVLFFGDVDLNSASDIVGKYGKVVGSSELMNALVITIPEENITKLAEEEEVEWIEEIPGPPKMLNDGARASIGVNTVQASPYNLDGTGIVTAEWDGGWVDTTHDDLQGRVTIGDTGSSTGHHATHVAGTMLGD
jgi:hypothetical protein